MLLKEQTGQLAYALYAGTDNGAARAAHVFTTADIGLRGPAALPLSTWSHLAMTWDGADDARSTSTARRSRAAALTGTAVTSSGPLRIGGNGVWPEWFNGLIDEVRVYNRALSAARDRRRPRPPVGGASRSARA